MKKYFQKWRWKILSASNLIPYEEANAQIWSIGAEVFIPAAGSRMVSHLQLEQMISNGLEVISSGANVPFNDPDIFLGETGIYADNAVACIPDFIANCGMARTFAYLMQPNISLKDEAIFADVSHTIEVALQKTYNYAPENDKQLWQNSLAWVLEGLVK